MMELPTIVYRKGLPTKKSLYEFIEKFDRKMSLHTNHLYATGRGNNILLWQDRYTQSRMDDFIAAATEAGVEFGKYDPYDSPAVGHLHVNIKTKQQ